MRKFTLILAVLSSIVGICAQTTVADIKFSTYSNGALVNQNSWTQYNTSTDRPITVNNGKVAWTGGNTTDGQDAVYLLPNIIEQPATGTKVLNVDLMMSVTSAGASPSYFFALNTLNTTVTTSNFQNARLAAKTLDDGFVLGARVNGQSGYAFAYGTSKLTFGTTYAVRLRIEMVAGNANDLLKVYVGPTFDNLVLQSTSSYGTGTVADPTFGAILLSQFGNSTTNESGVSFESIKLTDLGLVSGFETSVKGKQNFYVQNNVLKTENIEENTLVEIFSVDGKKIITSKVIAGSVNISNLKGGLYIARVNGLAKRIKK